MMKTPDETKKGLECCARVGCCHTCPYDEECHSSHDDACPMHMDALSLIQQLEAQVPKWISVEERLPEPKEDVALYIRCGDVSFIRTGWRMGNGQFICPNDSLSCYEVTHWMPLPEPPKEESQC